MKEISSNGLSPIIAQAIEEMKAEQGKNFSLEKINLAELERRTGVTRAKLRRLKENGFADTPHALKGRKSKNTLLSGYTGIIDSLLKQGILFMKHEITTYNTKKMLATSLKKAMKHKPFSKITVSEIIADCGVNRKTFYYHFEDIYALLTWMFEEEAIDIVKQFDLLTDYEQAIRFVMDYVDKNEYLVNCACHSISRDEMKRFFYADFVGIVTSVIDAAEVSLEKKLPPEFKKFAAVFYTEALAGMLIDWVKEKESRDKEKTLIYLSAIIKTAIDSLKLYAKDVSKLV